MTKQGGNNAVGTLSAGLEQRVEDLEITIYKGNGEPSLLSRMKVQENNMALLLKLAWGLFGCSLTVLAAVVVQAVMRK